MRILVANTLGESFYLFGDCINACESLAFRIFLPTTDAARMVDKASDDDIRTDHSKERTKSTKGSINFRSRAF